MVDLEMSAKVLVRLMISAVFSNLNESMTS